MHFLATGVVIMGLFLSACAGQRPDNLGVRDGRLAPCPASPNCVSSDATGQDHAIAALEFNGDPQLAWESLMDVLEEQERMRIITATRDYAHAECSSRLFGFIDDLELHLRPTQGMIAVRSASRLGYSDLGVNRKRVERLREQFEQRSNQSELKTQAGNNK